ncbi:MAG: DUF971 domain-containing protein [Betaproteobacteria bacterium]|nr:DUF971 domain-containing protein [Betaproteobacteria bacterium]
MAGLDKNTPTPVGLEIHQKSRTLEIIYAEDERHELSFEFLRVFTPSAEARGHGPGQEVLQVGKKNVGLVNIEAVGTYALRLIFTDGHDSGFYSWDLLYNFCLHRDELWQSYLDRIEATGQSREPADEENPAKNTSGMGCGSKKGCG